MTGTVIIRNSLAVLAVAAFILSSTSVNADLITISATAPTPDGDDISMLNAVGQYDIGGNQGHIWFNRPVQGQSFTTGSNPGGYLLNAVTLQNLNNTIATSPTFTLRVGTISGTAFTSFGGATGVPASYVPLDFLTFNLDSSIPLSPNTLYGFDWGSNAQGFVTVNNADSNYPGGSAFSSGSGGVGNTAITLHEGAAPNHGDRIFHLAISTIPEPSTVALSLMGLALLWRRQRQPWIRPSP